jgi:hypothetical protein
MVGWRRIKKAPGAGFRGRARGRLVPVGVTGSNPASGRNSGGCPLPDTWKVSLRAPAKVPVTRGLVRLVPVLADPGIHPERDLQIGGLLHNGRDSERRGVDLIGPDFQYEFVVDLHDQSTDAVVT